MAAPLLLMPEAAHAGGLVKQPSPQQQKELGEKAAQEVTRKYKEVFDGRARHFNELGQRLVASLPARDRATWDYKFHVLDSKEINAFALPGGNMFMFTGLYEKVGTDDALAAVTGHEMTHVRKEHWAKAYVKQQERQLGLTGLGALLGIFGAGRRVQEVVSMGSSAYDTLTGLKFSRREEDEADRGGLDNLVASGYNPQGMIQLFELLQKSSHGSPPAFLSDHPLTGDRIKVARQRIAAFENKRDFPPLTPVNYNSLY